MPILAESLVFSVLAFVGILASIFAVSKCANRRQQQTPTRTKKDRPKDIKT